MVRGCVWVCVGVCVCVCGCVWVGVDVKRTSAMLSMQRAARAVQPVWWLMCVVCVLCVCWKGTKSYIPATY